MKIPEIVQLGNPILRQHAKSIIDPTSESVQKLIDILMETVLAKNGVGIASPQIAESYRLFIVASRPNPRYPYAPRMKPTAMINPQITADSSEIVKGWEGCLSLPDIRGLVPRYTEIEVEYSDRFGHLQKRVLTDFIARIFQHELDHLDGILFIDRLESEQDRYSEAEYQQIISRQY